MPVSAFNATVEVLPGGDAYQGAVTLVNESEYSFWKPGHLGETLTLEVENVTVSGECGTNCTYTWENKNTVSFEQGNVTVGYEAEVKSRDLQVLMTEPSNITLTLPEDLMVSNPLLGWTSTGAEVKEEENGTTMVQWENTRYAEVRFYDSGQEQLLYIFGSVWVAVAAVLLFPYLLLRRQRPPEIPPPEKP
ncbi:hypothetical protein J2129_000152 [Methanofollis sp. W23]|nr:hypothetical protein [Methanofollis sp. W23]